jgi:DNA mismatch repair protein MutS
MTQYTPMIQQYLRVKADQQDAFLFFRLGDFYEMFFEDAIKASQVLEITLTSREGGSTEKIPMCGVPYHAAPNYIEQLINKGYKVAICEQVEDPKTAKGVVKREVVQVITPGTVMDSKAVLDKENNYLATIEPFENGTFGFAFVDLSTGELKGTIIESSVDTVWSELSVLSAKEVVLPLETDPQWEKDLKNRAVVTISYEEQNEIRDTFVDLIGHLADSSLKQTMARLLHYVFSSQKRSLDHLQKAETYEINQFMKLDFYSKRNLELTESIRGNGKKGTLLWLLDETVTAMGGRLLKSWLDRPLLSKDEISKRQTWVALFLEHYFAREDLKEKLKEVYDLERLAGRVAFGNVNARDLIQLKKSLQQIPLIQQELADIDHELPKQMLQNLDACPSLLTLLDQSIVEQPPLSIKEGNMIQDGFNSVLDQYRDASRNGKKWIAELEQKERHRTGIKSLKIGYNRVFGYYIEITKANLIHLQEERYDRKQTLSNAERFITPELKEKEALILEAEEKSVDLEYELFASIREQVKDYIPRLQLLAKKISELDVLQCFATVSEKRHYNRPELTDNQSLVIHDGRHPVVEKVMGSQDYVPNDASMSSEEQILLITGPNMSGKSTYMRQVALTAILAQVGCYVPAEKAILPIFDQIFTRIGAADDLISGQSTFMVEMLEAKNALVNATSRSLILFDEIGRGTSTYDGMALAQAMMEYIHHKIGALTLFSTHYHELTALESSLDHLVNVHVRAVEQNGKVVFLHKIKDGPADKSYGIHVAELAELPQEVISRAMVILSELEEQSERMHEEGKSSPEIVESIDQTQLSFFVNEDQQEKVQRAPSLHSNEKKIIQELQSLELLSMTPLQAMNILYELQQKLKSKGPVNSIGKVNKRES